MPRNVTDPPSVTSTLIMSCLSTDAAGQGRDEGVHPSTALAVSHAHGTDVAHPDEMDNSSRPLAERLTDALAERADVMARLAVAQVSGPCPLPAVSPFSNP